MDVRIIRMGNVLGFIKSVKRLKKKEKNSSMRFFTASPVEEGEGAGGQHVIIL